MDEVIILKERNGVATVLQYQKRRYVLDAKVNTKTYIFQTIQTEDDVVDMYIVKVKNNVPTVLGFEGCRYILEHPDRYKGKNRKG